MNEAITPIMMANSNASKIYVTPPEPNGELLIISESPESIKRPVRLCLNIFVDSNCISKKKNAVNTNVTMELFVIDEIR
jgi:hypothetical protein